MMNRKNCVTLAAVKVVVVLKTICDQQKYCSFEKELQATLVENVIFESRLSNDCVIVNRKRRKDRLSIHSIRVREAIFADSHVLDSHVLDSHVLDSHVLNSRMLDSHVLDSHVLDSHVLNSHVLDSHVLDSHVLDSHGLDGRIGSATRIEILEVTNVETELAVRKYENSELLNEELRLLSLWVTDQRFSDRLRSFLLWGLGSDKDSIVKYIVAKSNARLIPLDFCWTRDNSRSDLKLRGAIENAISVARHRLCMIYIEELDRFCRYANPLALAYLETLKDLDCAGNIVFCATTELLSDIDDEWKAAFGRRICVQGLNQAQRRQVLEYLLPEEQRAPDLYLETLSDATAGRTELELRKLVLIALHNRSEGRSLVSQGDFEFASEETSSRLKKSEKESTLSSEVGGYKDIRTRLEQATIWPLTCPEVFYRLGEQPPKGILLYGPPGCGKTSLVRSVALSNGINFFAVSSVQIYSPYVGDSEKKLVALMQKAKACAPSIVFLDDIDCIIGKRALSSGESERGGCGAQERVISSLLNCLDGIGNRATDLHRRSEASEVEVNGKKIHYDEQFEDSVLLVAATNALDMVDKALLRPGRIDEVIHVPPPDFEGRIQILRKYVTNNDLNFAEIAKKTENFTGAELETLCNQAYLIASRSSFDDFEVELMHFDEALARRKRTQPR